MTISSTKPHLRALTRNDRMGLPQLKSMRPMTGEMARGLPSQPSTDDQVHRLAQQLVGQTFFGTLMRQIENSPFKTELTSGGRGGEAFNSMLHQQLAERAGRGAGEKLANAIAKGIKRNLENRRAA